MEYGVPVYTTQQLFDYGEPDHYGIWKYIVITTLDFERPMVTSWKDEQTLCVDLKFKHFYSRPERFRGILFQLLGIRYSKTHFDVVDEISEYDEDPNKVWKSIRSVLKNLGRSKFYNEIPSLLKHLKYPLSIKLEQKSVLKIIKDFERMSSKFDKNNTTKKYFPSLRFVALKLLKIHGAVFEYTIPMVMTRRKEKELETSFSSIY